MRFLLAGSVPFWAFVTDLDTCTLQHPRNEVGFERESL